MVEVIVSHKGNGIWKEAEEYIRSVNWGTSLADRMENGSWEDWEAVILAKKKEKIVGFCTAVANDNIPDTSVTPFIGYVYVDEKERGDHLSGMMIEVAEDILRQHGFHQAYIRTGHNGLYEKFGYRYDRQIKDNKDRDERLYRKCL